MFFRKKTLALHAPSYQSLLCMFQFLSSHRNELCDALLLKWQTKRHDFKPPKNNLMFFVCFKIHQRMSVSLEIFHWYICTLDCQKHPTLHMQDEYTASWKMFPDLRKLSDGFWKFWNSVQNKGNVAWWLPGNRRLISPYGSMRYVCSCFCFFNGRVYFCNIKSGEHQ